MNMHVPAELRDATSNTASNECFLQVTHDLANLVVLTKLVMLPGNDSLTRMNMHVPAEPRDATSNTASILFTSDAELGSYP